jgi:hypothetical protein
MRLLSLFMLFAATTAFTSPRLWGTTKSVAPSSQQRFMFSADDDTKAVVPAKPLATMDEPAVVAPVVEAPESAIENLVEDMSTGEVRKVQWVDPAMAASSNPLQMSWYVC